MILIIDNYDSFVYNLAQYIGEMGCEPVVFRNDAITVKQIEELDPSHIIISPGPCTPREAGVSNDVIRFFGGRKPVLGVCLGHQCIGHVYGAEIVKAPCPAHGKSALINHDGQGVLKDIKNPLQGGRYHSLAVGRNGFPDELLITAETAEGDIMGVRHREFTVEGLQFHPESIMTPAGHAIISNFLKLKGATWKKKYISTEN